MAPVIATFRCATASGIQGARIPYPTTVPTASRALCAAGGVLLQETLPRSTTAATAAEMASSRRRIVGSLQRFPESRKTLGGQRGQPLSERCCFYGDRPWRA